MCIFRRVKFYFYIASSILTSIIYEARAIECDHTTYAPKIMPGERLVYAKILGQIGEFRLNLKILRVIDGGDMPALTELAGGPLRNYFPTGTEWILILRPLGDGSKSELDRKCPSFDEVVNGKVEVCNKEPCTSDNYRSVSVAEYIKKSLE